MKRIYLCSKLFEMPVMYYLYTPNNNDTVIPSLPLWMVIEAHVVGKAASQLREFVYQA